MGRFVAGSRLAALAGTLDQALRPDITVRTEIAPDPWDFNADPEELYFVLLNLCRNSADATPAHIKLMTRSMPLTVDDLVAVATDLGVNVDFALGDNDALRHARAREEADIASAQAV